MNVDPPQSPMPRASEEALECEDTGASSSSFVLPMGGTQRASCSQMEEADEGLESAEKEMDPEDAFAMEQFHEQCAAADSLAGRGESGRDPSVFARLFHLDRHPIYVNMTRFCGLLRELGATNPDKLDVAAALSQVLIPQQDPGNLGLPLLACSGERPHRNFTVLPWSFRLGQPEGEVNITLWVREVLELVGDNGGRVVFAGDEKIFSALVKFKQLHGWDRVVPFIGDFHVLMKMQSVILELLAEGEIFFSSL